MEMLPLESTIVIDFDMEVRALKDLCILGIAFALCRFSQSRKGDQELYSAKV